VSILDGKGTRMPSFRDKLSRERARELVAYIRTFAPGAADRAAPKTDEFDRQFSSLVQEIDELMRQMRALSSAHPRSPTNPPESGTSAKKK
jgi:hypothetical protein